MQELRANNRIQNLNDSQVASGQDDYEHGQDQHSYSHDDIMHPGLD
jgi:hypothetical protein